MDLIGLDDSLLSSLPAMWETQVRSLGWKDPQEKEMAAHSNILPGKSHERRTLTGYSPLCHSQTWLATFTFIVVLQYCVGSCCTTKSISSVYAYSPPSWASHLPPLRPPWHHRRASSWAPCAELQVSGTDEPRMCLILKYIKIKLPLKLLIKLFFNVLCNKRSHYNGKPSCHN